jgi:hypothetical protein
MEKRRIETSSDLEEVIGAQNRAIQAMGELLRGMDLKIKTLVTLVDNHQLVIKQLTGIVAAAGR